VVQTAGDVLAGHSRKGCLGRLLPFLGPAFIACVAYVDPGNFATNIQGGAQFGYRLLWVVLGSNVLAMLVQSLSAKLGIATGLNLAEQCRERYPKGLVVLMWLVSEIAAMATDLAEFLGAAVGFELLFNIPLLYGGLLTAVVTFAILGLERRGFRPLEAVITALVGVIAVCYVLETILEWRHLDLPALASGAFVPRLGSHDAVVLAVGILGATVMPHVIFLHSALTQGRIVTRDPAQLRRLFRFQLADIGLAMGLAGLVNGAMLVMAAAVFFANGKTDVATIEQAHQTLQPLLGKASSWVFGISLLASGLSSSAVGTMAGQVIMQGFMRRHIPVWVRRLVTMLPSLLVIAIGLEPTKVLIYSQVVLSFGLPFALVPLVQFTRRRDVMGVLVNHWLTTLAAGACTVLIITLNVYLVWQTLTGAGG
jgi:manganese transport protein